MITTLLDPTAELQPAARQLNDRLSSLAGITVGLLDISKPRGKEFLMGAKVKRYCKPTFTRLAPTELSQQISVECDAVIEGLAD
jgi:hypothetical protein